MWLRLCFLVACWSTWRCDGLYDPANHIESARLYGNIDEYAYWFVDLLVGTPVQRVSLILDTGSGLAAFPCASCAHCGRHIDPNFDITKSSTAKWMTCGGGCPGSCKAGKCSYYQGYQEGSAISGNWFQDYVRLGDAIQRNPPVFTKMGCHNNENNLFYTQQANGILGIRGGNTLLKVLFGDKAHVQTSTFALCFAEWGGRLVVGGYNSSYHTSKGVWIPLNVASYTVSLSSMKVGGGASFSSFGHTMVDSGTTYTYMGATPYYKLKKGIEDYCASHGNCGAQKQGKACWILPNAYETLKLFPTVEVFFGQAISPWEPRGYLYRKGTSKTFCYSFENDGPGAGTVLGASWMLYKEVIFDLNNKKLGIIPANCPNYKKRPKHRTTDLTPPIVGTPTAALAATAAPVATIAPPATQPPGATIAPVAGTQVTQAPFKAAALNAGTTVSVSLAPIEPAQLYKGGKAGKKAFMDFTRIAVVSAVAAFALGVIVYYACRSSKKDVEVGETPKEINLPATVVGPAGDKGNDEENQGLMEERESSRRSAPVRGGDDSDDGKEQY